MSKKEKTSAMHKVLTVVGWILCVILVPILIINCTLLVKSFLNQDKVPDFGGTFPLIVLSDSMAPDIYSGDLILCQGVEPSQVQVGDVISFFDPAGNGSSVVTHKVIEILNDNGKLSFRTKGINNNTEDRLPVAAEKVFARYSGFRIPGAGHVSMFMQTPAGLVVCVVVPMVLLVGYDLIRRRLYEKSKGDDVAALKAELEALKAANAAKAQAAEPTTEAPAQVSAEADGDSPQE